MTHRRTWRAIAGAAVIAVCLQACGPSPKLLVSSAAPGASGLPGDAILLDAGAAGLDAPFTLQPDPAAHKGFAVVLVQGAASPSLSGRASFATELPKAGRYVVWLHVRWDDACGNSLSVSFDSCAETAVAEDAVFETWHWARGGVFDLAAGPQTLRLAEREDGVALDAVLLTTDAEYTPQGLPARQGTDLRRFGDDFARSPGHGLGAWKPVSGAWEIAFNLDPNRIPNQYALAADATAAPALVLLDGPAWRGCRMVVDVCPDAEGRFGVVVDRSDDGSRETRVGIEIKDGAARLDVQGLRGYASRALGNAVRLQQWHRLVVERWDCVLRVLLDDRRVFEGYDSAPSGGRIGFFAEGGRAVFDDVLVEEIVWLVEDGLASRIPWSVDTGAEWYRPGAPESGCALMGRGGSIRARWEGLVLEEALIAENYKSAPACAVLAPGLRLGRMDDTLRAFRPSPRSARASDSLTLGVDGAPVNLRRVAARFGPPRSDLYRIGPYTFDAETMPDPSDYLDFTPEEYKTIAGSPDVDKLRREAKFMPVIGPAQGSSPWAETRSNTWTIRNGALAAQRPRAVVKHLFEMTGPFEMHAQVALARPDAVLDIVLYAEPGEGARVRLTAETVASPPKDAVLQIAAPADGRRRALTLSAAPGRLTAALDGEPSGVLQWGGLHGGVVRLEAPRGGVEMDDITFHVPRRCPGYRFYPFDRHESDWWRTGETWLDHGGVTCVLASNWISLIAPQGRGMLWNKAEFGADLVVAFATQEYTEWFGWTVHESHTHHPTDNIVAALAVRDSDDEGYRIEFNAEQRRATILYRNGVEVARVAQGGAFPLRYIGGHTPYAPRTNRFRFAKQGNTLCAVVNGQEVLRYRDPDPIPVARVGLGGHDTRINFTHVQILECPLP